MAGNVDALYIFLLLLSAFMCVAIFTLILVFAMQVPAAPGRAAEQIEGSTGSGSDLVHDSTGNLFVIFAWGAFIYFQERTPPRDATEIYVVAKQWMWKIQHVEGQREINELHVPVGRDVKLIMTSQDVIHSFYVPAFRIKQDVLPGRYTTAWFRATKPGTYHLFCARVLRHHALGNDRADRGDGAGAIIRHGSRGGTVVSLAVAERSYFCSTGLSTCHRSDTQGRGPNLVGVFGKPVRWKMGERSSRTRTTFANHFESERENCEGISRPSCRYSRDWSVKSR